MCKSFLLICILLACCYAASAQITHKDSVTEIAKADTKSFILNKEDLKTFRRLGPRRRYSDLFKPKEANVSNVTLLNDSNYVQAYRHIAFIKTRKRHTAGHYIFIIGSSIIGAVAIGSIVALSTGAIYIGSY